MGAHDDGETEPVMFAVGAPAPDARLRDQDGVEVTLASYWMRQSTVFVFLRHFG